MVRLISTLNGSVLSPWADSQIQAVETVAANLEGNPKIDGDRHLIIKTIDHLILKGTVIIQRR